VGSEALYYNTTGNGNIAFGAETLADNETGNYNIAIGYQALNRNTDGEYNIAIGYEALNKNTTGKYNTANGYQALNKNMTGNYNVANGYQALNKNTTGNYNVANGFQSLYNITTGSYNTAIGYETGSTTSNFTNTTNIGNGAKAATSNQVRIGNANVTSIGGYVGWTNISDARIKRNIRHNVPGLAFINLLQPVTYNLDLDAADKIVNAGNEESNNDPAQALSQEEIKARAAKQELIYSGFLAQDVEAAAQSIGYDFSGVDASGSENDLYGLRYAEFVVPLVKAVQELSEQSDARDDAIVLLQEQLAQLTERVENRIREQGGDPIGLRGASESEAATGLENPSTASASLQQNFPNPFNQSTTIRYTLPDTFQSARIVITGATGKIAKQIPVTGSGTGSLTIEAASLVAGTYYYSLFVDDRLIDTKIMLLF
jgi:hypothetical protein